MTDTANPSDHALRVWHLANSCDPDDPDYLAALDTDTIAASCHDCGEAYGSPRFPDLVLPHDMWARISPSGDENGLLCPNCTCARAEAADIECRAVFRSGPFSDASGTHEAMNAQPDTIARLTAENERLRRERDAALAGAVDVRPLDCYKTQGWTDENGKFCLPLSDGYYVKFPSDSDGLFAVWYHKTILGCDRMMRDAKQRAQADYRARILAALHPSPDALQAVTALIETVQWARNRLELIADESWHGDGRDMKRSIIGVFADFDAALAGCGSAIPDELRRVPVADALAAQTRRDAQNVAKGMRAAADLLDRMAKDTPLGHENRQRGASTYNWLTAHRDAITALAAQTEEAR